MTSVSIYSNIAQTKGGKEIPVDILLDYIQTGQWQDKVLWVRTAPNENELAERKKQIPYATISGKFSERNKSGLVQHSGFICIDVDDVDPEETKSLLCPDKYVYSAFVSASGKGLAVMFRINPDKHAEAFEGLQEYLYTNYQIVVDPSCRDVSRARFVSYDPYLYLNEKADKFTHYPKKLPAAMKKVPDVVFVQSDFDSIVQEIVMRRLDITDSYQAWLRIGFAISDKFQEAGRQYFHLVSQYNQDYKYDLADRQYTNCLKAGKSGITIASFYYYAKQAGIRTVSEQTKLIVQSATFAKKGARTRESVVKMLQESDGISPDESSDIINQVFENNIKVESNSEIDAIELWMSQNYSLRRNLITRYIENNGKPLQKKDLNSIYIASKKVFEKGSFELIDRLINSDFTQDYNPLHEFFEKYQDRKPSGTIRALFDSINTDTGMEGGTQFFPDYKYYFGVRWLVGMISAAFGAHSVLMLVLSGSTQNTGKTQWFRRLLPAELSQCYAESKLDAGKDDEILMTQKWLIVDDEMGGKSKAEERHLKTTTSKQIFSLREPYGHSNVDLVRLAVLGGTSNENGLINDATGNRRIIPINVLSIDHAAYNAVDKIDVLMEAYWMWKEGFHWELTSDDIKILKDNTGYFEEHSIEEELITRHYEVPTEAKKSIMTYKTGTDIKVKLEMYSGQRLSKRKLCQELKKLGFVQENRKLNAYERGWYYAVIERTVF